MRTTARDPRGETDARLTAVGLAMLALLGRDRRGAPGRSPRRTGRARVDEAGEVRRLHRIYTLTLAWVFTYLPEWTRTRRVVGWITAVTLVLEIVIIDVQAWRGTTSHFNVGTPFDGVLFTIMGLAIVVQTLTSIAVAVGVVAAAVRRPRARLGAAPRHDDHDRRRDDGRADDRADARAARTPRAPATA